MRKVKHHLCRLQHSKIAKHGHHGVYFIYYVISAIDHRGVTLVLVAVIATLHAIATFTGEE